MPPVIIYVGRIERADKRRNPALESESLLERMKKMKHAVILTGGKQYRVAEGDVIYIEKLDAEAGSSVTFDKVLAITDDESENVFGSPIIEGASVIANVVKNGRGKKIRVFKMKPKKGYHRTQGHRQPYTKVQIEKIS